MIRYAFEYKETVENDRIGSYLIYKNKETVTTLNE